MTDPLDEALAQRNEWMVQADQLRVIVNEQAEVIRQLKEMLADEQERHQQRIVNDHGVIAKYRKYVEVLEEGLK